jgi:hypothetical protein
MVAHGYNPKTWEKEAGGWQGQSELHSKFVSHTNPNPSKRKKKVYEHTGKSDSKTKLCVQIHKGIYFSKKRNKVNLLFKE